jgi:DnaJ-class molecular chaperone
MLWDLTQPQVLGIARDATEREIKRSYRRLALALHPDKLGPNATEAQKQRFISINQAYEVLSDESQRKRYDEIGEALFSAPVQVAKQYGEDPFDMFISFKRGGFRFRYTKKVQRQAAAVVLGAELTLEELLHEHEVTMVTERSVTCSHCHGTGAAGPEHVHTCGVCHGDGRLSHLGYAGEAYRHVVRTKCPVCGGWGRTITDACPVCKGTHVVPEPVSYTFKVPAGAKDGHEVVLRGSGNHAFLQKVGDAVLVIKRTPHPIFRVRQSLRVRLSCQNGMCCGAHRVAPL